MHAFNVLNISYNLYYTSKKKDVLLNSIISAGCLVTFCGHEYTCAIDIKTVLMDWNHQLPKLLYIVCCTTFLMDHSIFMENRGQRPEKKISN